MSSSRAFTLHQTGLMNSVSERAFDNIAYLAKLIFNTDIVLISLIDDDQQWFKAKIGLSLCETPVDISICQFTIQSDEPFIINDALTDSRFVNNPLVTGYPYIRFYSGIALHAPNGQRIGTLCLIHGAPRTISSQELKIQRHLVHMIEYEIMRRSQAPVQGTVQPSRLNEVIIKAQHLLLTSHNDKLTFDILLDDILKLTSSAFGLIGEVLYEDNSQPYLKVHSLTNIAWSAETNALFERNKTDGLEFRNLDNLLCKPLVTGDVVITDNAIEDSRSGGTPYGHPPIKNYVGIPVYSGETMVGLIGLANGINEYTSTFVDSLHALISVVGVLIERNRMVQERKQFTVSLQYAAYHDELTGLPNRRKLDQEIKSLTHRQQPSQFSVCYIDLDSFKPINDNYGHEVGDKILKLVAKRIKHLIGTQDSVARISGDEFVIVLNAPANDTDYQKITDTLAQPYAIDDIMINLSASMGVAVYPNDTQHADQLIRFADQSMYQAKSEGKNQVSIHDAKKASAREHKIELIKELMYAIDDRQIECVYQPKFDMNTNTVVGVEVLSRWRHKKRGLLMPGAFIPQVEGSQAAIALDHYVLNEAHQLQAVWRRSGRDLNLSVNIGGDYFTSELFKRRLEAMAESNTGRNNGITLEILETTTIDDLDEAVEILNRCHECGYRTALDDFGTHYSSLTYFRRLPVDEIKIDRSFITNLKPNTNDEAIVESIIYLSRRFNRDVVAEGVETQEQADHLQALGCHLIQGYLISPPVSLEELNYSMVLS
ncbi:bifunctional diguanylate cyclase/phosphodiesterase [Idiomarina baltica]|uniref:PAS:GGDEF protein n=1 Tax=Idiomarina baltica OS145 TaxID=314276 RepID=A0ABM9WM11_9GAMM|nr:EAL domain-containing protein [Idiomarina baltica]EAQ31968.1 PAS:GGDEF protein [Idiomarina baltica OS145]